MLPHLLNWIKLWSVRRLKHQNDILGNLQSLRFMKATIIQLNNQHAISKLLRNQIEKYLKTSAVEMGKLKEEMLPCTRFNNAVNIGGLILPLHLPYGFNTSCCNFLSTDGLES